MVLDPETPIRESLRLNADTAELERLITWLDEFCERHGIPEGPHYHVNIAVEELVLNAITHGRCSPAEDAISIVLTLCGRELEIALSDTGQPFNPLDAPTPDLNRKLVDRPIGGLGIYLVRSLMNSIEYQHVNGENRVRMRKNW
jgi:anti-sigma regulatory factor (Ser/Thr protein kinase)